MTAHKIKMSARAVLGFLSGRIKQEDFVRENKPFVQAFERMVGEGRALSTVKIERVAERDDDWIEFCFSEADPAAGPFTRMCREWPLKLLQLFRDFLQVGTMSDSNRTSDS